MFLKAKTRDNHHIVTQHHLTLRFLQFIIIPYTDWTTQKTTKKFIKIIHHVTNIKKTLQQNIKGLVEEFLLWWLLLKLLLLFISIYYDILYIKVYIIQCVDYAPCAYRRPKLKVLATIKKPQYYGTLMFIFAFFLRLASNWFFVKLTN